MRKLSLMVLFLAVGCGDGGDMQQTGPAGKWRLLVQSAGVTWITLEGTFLRNGNVVTAQ
jgi:hypothetical protein